MLMQEMAASNTPKRHSTQPNTQKLTVYEWNALTSPCNLADGHPRQSLQPAQEAMLWRLPSLFLESHSGHEVEAKERFEKAFFEFAGQSAARALDPPLSQYSGSVAIELLANYLRMHRKTVAFLHPSFDSIADTLRRHNVPLTPLDEDMLAALSETSPKLPVDALYIVCPNNPTGRCLTETQFRNIVAYCKKYNLLLIIDFCFRFYGDFWGYDQYDILQSAGIDFITTEDTGKIWPAADVKLGMVLASRSIYPELKTISDDFLLSVSPFVFALLTCYIELEQPGSMRIWSQRVAHKNRRILRSILAASPIKSVSGTTAMSVEWLQLPRAWQAALFAEHLATKGVQVLPGERFYWNDHAQGARYIRIALLRDESYFRQAITRLRHVADEYQP